LVKLRHAEKMVANFWATLYTVGQKCNTSICKLTLSRRCTQTDFNNSLSFTVVIGPVLELSKNSQGVARRRSGQ